MKCQGSRPCISAEGQYHCHKIKLGEKKHKEAVQKTQCYRKVNRNNQRREIRKTVLPTKLMVGSIPKNAVLFPRSIWLILTKGRLILRAMVVLLKPVIHVGGCSGQQLQSLDAFYLQWSAAAGMPLWGTGTLHCGTQTTAPFSEAAACIPHNTSVWCVGLCAYAIFTHWEFVFWWGGLPG